MPVARVDVRDATVPAAPVAPLSVAAPGRVVAPLGEAQEADTGWDAAGRVRTSRQQVGLLIAAVAFAFVVVVAGTAYLAWTPPSPAPAPATPVAARPAAAPSTGAVASAVPPVTPAAVPATSSGAASVGPPLAAASTSAALAPVPTSTSEPSTAPTTRGLGWPSGSSFGAASAPSPSGASDGGEGASTDAAPARVGAVAGSGALHVRLEDGFGGGRLVFKCLTGSSSHALTGAAVDLPGLAEGCTAKAACDGGQVISANIVPGTTRAVCGGCTPDRPQPSCRAE